MRQRRNIRCQGLRLAGRRIAVHLNPRVHELMKSHVAIFFLVATLESGSAIAAQSCTWLEPVPSSRGAAREWSEIPRTDFFEVPSIKARYGRILVDRQRDSNARKCSLLWPCRFQVYPGVRAVLDTSVLSQWWNRRLSARMGKRGFSGVTRFPRFREKRKQVCSDRLFIEAADRHFQLGLR